MAAVQHYTIRWGDRTYHTQELTGVELVALEEKIGPWYRWRAQSAHDCAWLIAAFLKKEGVSGAELEKVIEAEVLPALTIDFLAENVEAVSADLPTVYEEGIPDPKAEVEETSTTG